MTQPMLPGMTPPTENSRQEAGTPRRIFDVLHREYRFTIDVCAVEHNAKLPLFWSPADDALTRNWGGVRAWCNPEFGDIAPWLEHALEPELACYLLPADRTGREWWRIHKPRAEVHYFRSEGDDHCRIEYVPPPGVVYKNKCGFESCLFLFGLGMQPGLEIWRSGRTGERL